MKNKGQSVKELQSAALAIVIIIIIVAIGSQIIGSMQSNFKETTTASTLNETPVTASFIVGTLSNPITLAHTGVASITDVRNVSVTVPTSNYTLSGGYLYFTDVKWNNTGSKVFNVSYTYQYDEPTYSYNITAKGLGAMSNFSDWYSIIVIIVIAVVIIALLIGAFRGAGGSA